MQDQSEDPLPPINLPKPIPDSVIVPTKPDPAPAPLPKGQATEAPAPLPVPIVADPVVPTPAMEKAPAPAPIPKVDPQLPPVVLPTDPPKNDMKPNPMDEIILVPVPDPIPVVEAPKKEPGPVEPPKKVPTPFAGDQLNKGQELVIESPKVDPAPGVDPSEKAPPSIVIMPTPEPGPKIAPRADQGKPLAVNPTTVEPIESKGPIRPPTFRLVNPIRRANAMVDDGRPSLPGQAGLKPAPLETVLMAGAQAAQMSLEKRGPRAVVLGQNIPYLIVIRNTGSTPALQLRVEDEIPAGATVVTAEPAARRVGNRLVWTLEGLPAGGEKQFRVELQPQKAGDLVSDTIANVILSTPTRTRVISGDGRPNPMVQGAMLLTVTGPRSALVNQPVTFEVEVVNQGREKLTGLLLLVTLPPGLQHAKLTQVEKLEAPVGDLEPNTKRSFNVETIAKIPGRHVVDIRMTAQNAPEASGLGEVLVAAKGVQVHQAPATRLVLHRDGELRLDVTNHEAQPLTNITVTNQLPEGVDFVQASDRGIYRHETRTVYWLLESLAPGQTQGLAVKVQGAKNGQFNNQVIVRAQHVGEQRSTSQLQVEGLTDLTIKIAKKSEALELGRDSVYEIRLVNQGSSPATNILLQLNLTEGLTPKLAQGPTPGRVLGQQATFGAVPVLQPGGQAVFHLQARGDSAGDRRLRAQVTSDQLRQPLTKEDRTVVYQER